MISPISDWWKSPKFPLYIEDCTNLQFYPFKDCLIRVFAAPPIVNKLFSNIFKFSHFIYAFLNKIIVLV